MSRFLKSNNDDEVIDNYDYVIGYSYASIEDALGCDVICKVNSLIENDGFDTVLTDDIPF